MYDDGDEEDITLQRAKKYNYYKTEVWSLINWAQWLATYTFFGNVGNCIRKDDIRNFS